MVVELHVIVPKPEEVLNGGGVENPEEMAESTMSFANSSISQLRVALMDRIREGELS